MAKVLTELEKRIGNEIIKMDITGLYGEKHLNITVGKRMFIFSIDERGLNPSDRKYQPPSVVPDDAVHFGISTCLTELGNNKFVYTGICREHAMFLLNCFLVQVDELTPFPLDYFNTLGPEQGIGEDKPNDTAGLDPKHPKLWVGVLSRKQLGVIEETFSEQLNVLITRQVEKNLKTRSKALSKPVRKENVKSTRTRNAFGSDAGLLALHEQLKRERQEFERNKGKSKKKK